MGGDGMSEWKKVKLGEICEIYAGGDKPKIFCNYQTDECKVPVYSNGIDNDGLYGFTDIPRNNGNAITITGRGANAGTVFFRKKPFLPIIRLLTINPDIKVVNVQYLYYLLKDKQFLSTGSAQPQITVPNLSKYEIEYITNTMSQFHIATILSRYDSLIETYEKQIKLLEEAAQRLYKEWFVDLRFPGYENTPVVDGVPEGWEKKSVDSIYHIKYGKNLSTKEIHRTGKYPVYGANGVIGYYDKANCNNQVVLITSRGNGSGDVLMTYHKEAFITNNSFIVIPQKGFEFCGLPFTYQLLTLANFRSVRTGAAQPQLTNQSIHTVYVILPKKSIIENYCRIASKSNEQVIVLKSQIRLLTEARDRLIPKLMSGEIEV